jgi:hypothetical protein
MDRFRMIERGQLCMLPSRARMTAAEFDALPIIEQQTSRPKPELPDFLGARVDAHRTYRALVDGKWCLLTAQHHFGCKQVYAERITIVAKEHAP